MPSRTILLSLLLLLPCSASAQLGPAPDRDACGDEARRVGTAAAEANVWSTSEPRAMPLGTLGRAVIWRVVDNPRCCDPSRGCSSASERGDALVGVVGRRIFALSGPTPRAPASISGENRLEAPLVLRAWTRMIRAAGARPTSESEALALGWLVYASTFPGLGRVDDVSTFDPELAARARALGDLRPGAHRHQGGYEVVLWAGRRSSEGHLRDRGMGSSSDQRLRRGVVRIARDGTITVVEDVAVVGNIATRLPPTPASVDTPGLD